MRVSNIQFTSIMQSAISKNNADLNKVFEQMATGNKINRFSDDPLASVKLEYLEQKIAMSDQYSRNISNVQDKYDRYETYISSFEGMVQEVNELVLRGSNDSLSPESRQGIAIELEALKEEMLSVLNTQKQGSYIFSGTAVDTPAISLNPPYALQGNNDVRETKIGEGSTAFNNVTLEGVIEGNDIFNQLDKVISEFRSPSPTIDFRAVTDQTLEVIEDTHISVNKSLGVVGARYNSLERALQTNADMQLYVEAVKTDLIELDYAEANVRLNQGMLALEATQKSYTSIVGLSLFNML